MSWALAEAFGVDRGRKTHPAVQPGRSNGKERFIKTKCLMQCPGIRVPSPENCSFTSLGTAPGRERTDEGRSSACGESQMEAR